MTSGAVEREREGEGERERERRVAAADARSWPPCRTPGVAPQKRPSAQTPEARGQLLRGDDDELILPQVFIDGQRVGDAESLQFLEDPTWQVTKRSVLMISTHTISN